jgi:hypothetical protein
VRSAWTILALLILSGADAAAQRLVVEGSMRHPAAVALRELAARGTYRVIDRDTVLPVFFRQEGDLVVVDAVVRLEGSVTGSVAVVGGSFFLRPGARIGGAIVSAAGTVGSSGLATLGDTLALAPEYRVDVSRAGDEYLVRIEAPPRPALVAPQGLFGVVLPSYDRVNGATVRVGAGGSVGTDSLRPTYEVVGSYFSARGTVGGRGEFRLPMGGRAHLAFSGGREVLTRDAWIRDDLSNSLSALFVRSDVRNYYESDFGSVRIEQLPPPTLRVGEGYMVPRVGVTASRDRSLTANDPWTLFGKEPWRENPEVFEGTLTSASAGFASGWRGISSGFEATADLEWAFPSPLGFSWGEREFVQVTADGRWGALAMWDHSLTLRGHVMQTFGPDPAPPQRWSLIGGPGTLPTLEQGGLRGDNVLFLQSTYAIPLPYLTLPFVGIPELAAQHAVGTAWVSKAPAPRWQQNLALGVRFSVADLFVYVDPAADEPDPHFSVGFHLPR